MTPPFIKSTPAPGRDRRSSSGFNDGVRRAFNTMVGEYEEQAHGDRNAAWDMAKRSALGARIVEYWNRRETDPAYFTLSELGGIRDLLVRGARAEIKGPIDRVEKWLDSQSYGAAIAAAMQRLRAEEVHKFSL